MHGGKHVNGKLLMFLAVMLVLGGVARAGPGNMLGLDVGLLAPGSNVIFFHEAAGNGMSGLSPAVCSGVTGQPADVDESAVSDVRARCSAPCERYSVTVHGWGELCCEPFALHNGPSDENKRHYNVRSTI